MTTATYIILTVVVFGVGILFEIGRNRKRRLFLLRGDRTSEWRSRFPDATRVDIRAFLQDVNRVFSLGMHHVLNLSPDDKVLDIYRAAYAAGSEDHGCLQALKNLLRTKYRTEVYSLNDADLSLGDLFRMINFNNKAQPTAGASGAPGAQP